MLLLIICQALDLLKTLLAVKSVDANSNYGKRWGGQTHTLDWIMTLGIIIKGLFSWVNMV